MSQNWTESSSLFLDESYGILEHLRKVVAQASRNPDDEELWFSMNGALEILVSDSSFAKVPVLEDLSASMLLILRGLIEGRYHLTPVHLQLLGMILDYAAKLLDTLQAESQVDAGLYKDIVLASKRMYDRESFSLKGLSLEERCRTAVADAEVPQTVLDGAEKVSISISAMERLGTSLNSIIVQQFQLKKNGDVLQDMDERIRFLIAGLKDGTNPAGLLQNSEDLLKEIQNLRTGFKEDLAAVDRTSFNLQEEIAQLRMLPFRVLAERLEQHAAETAARTGKTAGLLLEGEDTLLDRMALDLVAMPLMELIDNAIEHGLPLDTPGQVHVSCVSDGHGIHIDVSDDGPGMDWVLIRDSVNALFPHEKDEIASMADGQLARYLFEVGISAGPLKRNQTNPEGMGLTRVKARLESMQGRVTLESERGHGVRCTLRFPASISLVHGFFVKLGGELFFISSVYIREIVIFERANLVKLPGGPCYQVRDQMVPVVPLASIFEGKSSAVRPIEQMIIVELMGETWGLVMDSIVRHASLGFRPLPDNLRGMKEIQGVVYDEKFNLVPILNIPAIIGRIRRLRSIEFRQRFQADDPAYHNILLVDDSRVVRDTMSRVIAESGYQIETAEDGIAALELLHSRFFHLLVCDDDMPRMDGLTLVGNLRKESSYAGIPIIMLSTGLTPGQIEELRKLEVTKYFLKADLDRQAFMKEISLLLNRA